MSQRHFIRRIAMELSTRSGLQEDGATPQTSVDATEDVVVQAGMDATPFSSSGSKENDQGFGGREQDPLLHNSSTMKNRGFTLLDVVRETVHLTRARSKYFLGLLPLLTLGMLLYQGSMDYQVYTTRPDHVIYNLDEKKEACDKNILRPWLEATVSRNMSSTIHEEFYTLFKQNCSMYQDPTTGTGTFHFKNGTVTMSTADFLISLETVFTPLVYGGFVAICLWGMWSVWAEVAVTWGLHVATRTTMSSQSRPSHRAPMHIPPQKLTEVFREQFSPKVLLGTIRVVLTSLLILIPSDLITYGITRLRSLVRDRSPSLPYLKDLPTLPDQLWFLANPLPFLFFLSYAAAALEPGMWGFRAMRRGIRLLKGNWVKVYAIFLVLFLWDWSNIYIVRLITLEPEKAVTQSALQAMGRSLGTGILKVAFYLPNLFLVPVLYLLCKSWREKVETMA